MDASAPSHWRGTHSLPIIVLLADGAGRFKGILAARGTYIAGAGLTQPDRCVPLYTRGHDRVISVFNLVVLAKPPGPIMSDDFNAGPDDLERRMERRDCVVCVPNLPPTQQAARPLIWNAIMVDASGQQHAEITKWVPSTCRNPAWSTINVWDKGWSVKLKKAIRESGLGINPQLNGKPSLACRSELNESAGHSLTKVSLAICRKRTRFRCR